MFTLSVLGFPNAIALRVGSQPHSLPMGFEPVKRRMKINRLSGGEGSTAVPFPPPLSVEEFDLGPSQGPFFFWFQRGLAMVTGLQRLAKFPDLVSDRPVSLSDRPLAQMGRIQEYSSFQEPAVFVRPSCSEVQWVPFCEANPGDGLPSPTRALAQIVGQFSDVLMASNTALACSFHGNAAISIRFNNVTAGTSRL